MRKPNNPTVVKATLICVSLFFYSQAFSQPHIGIKAGLSLPYQYVKIKGSGGSYSSTRDMNPGFHGGVVALFKLADKIGFQPELVFSAKGSKTKVTLSNGSEGTMSFRFNYIEVPLAFQYYFDIAKADLYIGAGPVFSLGISGKDKHPELFLDSPDPFELYANRFDAGALFQVGGLIKNVQVSFEYNLGLVDVLNDEKAFYPPDADAILKNRMALISAIYFFRLSRVTKIKRMNLK